MPTSALERVAMEPEKPLISVDEAAALMGVSRVAVYELAEREGLPLVRLSAKRFRVPRGRFSAWLSRRVSGEGEAPGEAVE